jgi:hypothetical protein
MQIETKMKVINKWQSKNIKVQFHVVMLSDCQVIISGTSHKNYRPELKYVSHILIKAFINIPKSKWKLKDVIYHVPILNEKINKDEEFDVARWKRVL